jgi:hypothetical protein
MKLYADENFPLDVVKELRNLGHDVITALEDGKANLLIPDESVLERAIELRSCKRISCAFVWLKNQNGFAVICVNL